jgi:hypothetical protein
MNDRQERAATLLDAWGEAIRGDWSSIDGRACRMELDAISAYLREELDTLSFNDIGVVKGKFGYEWG